MSSLFYVEKQYNTFADTLIAFGLTELVAALLDDQSSGQGNVRLHDKGSYYLLHCEPALDIEQVRNYRGTFQSAPLLMTRKNRETLEGIAYKQVDYEEWKQIRDAFMQFRQQTKNADKVPDELRPQEPHPDWDTFRAINPAALPGYNNLLIDWSKTFSARGDVLLLILTLFSSLPNDLTHAETAWKALDKANGWNIGVETTALQLYNPDQGKGQNRTKANALGMANVKGFWLLEVLKAFGFYKAGITRTMRGVKDRKTYVVAPAEISYIHSKGVLDHFKPFMQIARPSITSDIAALIHYVRAMLAYAAERRDFLDTLLGVSSGKPRDVVRGFYTAFYKDLGNAVATMNLSFIAIPGWITLRSSEDIARIGGLLNEIDRLTYSIDESHSDGYALLSALRDFLSGSALDPLFAFTNAYAGYYMGRRQRKQYAHQLSTEFIRSVVVGTEEKLTSIFENEGFRNIAYAIRQSTVTAQYRDMQGDRRYDVRYGLGQELARKARYPKEFLTALADFLHKYNAETVQVAERMNKMGRSEELGRRRVTTSDIEEVAGLIEIYGAPLIANLLIAYGYARVKTEQADQDIPQPAVVSDVPTDESEPVEDYE